MFLRGVKMIKTVCDRCGKEVKRDTTKDRYKILKVDLCIDCQSEFDDFMDKFLREVLHNCDRCRHAKKSVCKDCVVVGGKFNNFVCK